uniref:Uncharacterized protein n=1 Tax=Triticum urartu TaxID=4572 RepID=A0A8R7NZ56_TRIUA
MGRIKETKSNVHLASNSEMQYVVGIDVIFFRCSILLVLSEGYSVQEEWWNAGSNSMFSGHKGMRTRQAALVN